MKEIQRGRNYSMREVAEALGMCPKSARKFIKLAVPDIQKRGKRKMYYTPQEFRAIMNEYE